MVRSLIVMVLYLHGISASWALGVDVGNRHWCIGEIVQLLYLLRTDKYRLDGSALCSQRLIPAALEGGSPPSLGRARMVVESR